SEQMAFFSLLLQGEEAGVGVGMIPTHPKSCRGAGVGVGMIPTHPKNCRGAGVGVGMIPTHPKSCRGAGSGLGMIPTHLKSCRGAGVGVGMIPTHPKSCRGAGVGVGMIPTHPKSCRGAGVGVGMIPTHPKSCRGAGTGVGMIPTHSKSCRGAGVGPSPAHPFPFPRGFGCSAALSKGLGPPDLPPAWPRCPFLMSPTHRAESWGVEWGQGCGVARGGCILESDKDLILILGAALGGFVHFLVPFWGTNPTVASQQSQTGASH
uniref:Uncharacterized protein n=1 Tax=Corvus moneduloides TaxID=1196302 RepID=A0A8U7P7Z0_CORMO